MWNNARGVYTRSDQLGADVYCSVYISRGNHMTAVCAIKRRDNFFTDAGDGARTVVFRRENECRPAVLIFIYPLPRIVPHTDGVSHSGRATSSSTPRTMFHKPLTMMCVRLLWPREFTNRLLKLPFRTPIAHGHFSSQ